MPVRMEFLGTGTSQGVPVVACACAVCTSGDPKDLRLRSSVRITLGEHELLIDAGPDLRQQALRSGMHRLDAVLLTHEHMDHVAGIDELRAFNYSQKRAMDVFGQARALEAVQRTFHYAFAKDKYPGVPELELHPVHLEPFAVHGHPITPVEVMHDRLPVLGFRIQDVAYITDAKTIAHSERAKLRDLDVLVINALRMSPHHSHLNLEEALAVVADLAPRRAYLTHISHLLGKHADVNAVLPPGVELAYDGLVVSSGR